MPNSLRCKIKHLCHNGTLTERERDRILKVLEQETCEDAISRQDALDCLTATGLKKFDFILDARDKIKNLPSVTPKEVEECH